jgi:uncharacterized protein (TIGR02145 family)
MKLIITFLFLLATSFLNAQVTDIDGNTYKTVKIGEQVWMSENLKTTRFTNGDSIPFVLDRWDWRMLEKNETPDYGFYDDDSLKEGQYGKLYNYYVVSNGNIAPEGWRVPTSEDWEQLIRHLGKYEAAEKLKSTSGWHEEGNGTDEVGFNGLPGGFRDIDGSYRGLGEHGAFLSSSDNQSMAISYTLSYNRNLSKGYGAKRAGRYIRLIKN